VSHPPRIPPSFVPTLTEVLAVPDVPARDLLPTEPANLVFPVIDALPDTVPVLEPLLDFPPLQPPLALNEAALAQAIERALPVCLAQVLQAQGPAWLTQWSQTLVQELRQPLTDAVRVQLLATEPQR
jgi:hypothetical protein